LAVISTLYGIAHLSNPQDLFIVLQTACAFALSPILPKTGMKAYPLLWQYHAPLFLSCDMMYGFSFFIIHPLPAVPSLVFALLHSAVPLPVN
jgi:hypothetical protein